MLTLVSICFGSLAAWRVTQDVELTNDFVFREGLLSHWQVWTAAAVATQYSAWRLTRYARMARTQAVAVEAGAETEAQQPSQVIAKV